MDLRIQLCRSGTDPRQSEWLSTCGHMAAIVAGLPRGIDLGTALEPARTTLERHDNHDETSAALAAAIELAACGGGRMPAPEDTAGLDWTGPEVLAIGVFATLAAEEVGGTPEHIFRNGIPFAVNHSGDSDSTRAICGSTLGTRAAAAAVPPKRRTALDHRTLGHGLRHRIRHHCAERRLQSADGGVVCPRYFRR
ncbi:ADP-ribosylglycohydrolase family protein [Nocardia sp. NPDC052112]|uniref:ADP-ribosylglycohydrolase family protein n=1 Tax=Nocardia sp. NPDC052112 TaxID=3155646 RepID=UPI003416C055